MSDDVERQQKGVKQSIDALNDRISSANTDGVGWPTEDEKEALRIIQARVESQVTDFNTRVVGYNTDRQQLNREVGRYKLMMAFPHGLDEDSLGKPRSAPRDSPSSSISSEQLCVCV